MILCCGEALIDMLPRKTAAGDAAFSPHSGGAVFNTAVALARLGAQSGFYSGISDDLFGEVLCRDLDESGVDYSLASRSSRPTTLAFVTLVDGQAKYAFYDENTAMRMLTADDLPTLDDGISAMFFGGISLVSEPGATAYETLMTKMAGDRVTMIDPNIRPGFVTDETAYRARIERMLRAADIVKISDEDLAWIDGEMPIEELAKKMLARGPSLVLVTEGADGARGFTAKQSVFVPSQKVTVVDTVGAGDTFNAGVLASLEEAGVLTKSGLKSLDSTTIENALDLGGRAAAICVSRAGANPPWRREI